MTITSTDTGKLGTAAAEPRQRILEAAMRCFVENGFHSASMQQICAAASMSPGGVYRYFASKDEIIGAIFEHVQDRNNQYFDRMAAEGATFETFTDVGYSCLSDMMRESDRNLFCEVLAEAQRNPAMQGACLKSYTHARTMMGLALSRLQAAGEIDPNLDVQAATTMLIAVSDGLAVRMRFDPNLNFEAVWPGLKELVTRMLRPAGAMQTQTAKTVTP